MSLLLFFSFLCEALQTDQVLLSGQQLLMWCKSYKELSISVSLLNFYYDCTTATMKPTCSSFDKGLFLACWSLSLIMQLWAIMSQELWQSSTSFVSLQFCKYMQMNYVKLLSLLPAPRDPQSFTGKNFSNDAKFVLILGRQINYIFYLCIYVCPHPRTQRV